MMKRKKKLIAIGILIPTLLAALLFYGCTKKDDNQNGLTVDEPDVTVDYLASEYASQLSRDGAEHVFGSFTLAQDADGIITLNVAAKEYVLDETQPNGFYIADRNMDVTYTLAQEARTTFLSGGSSIATIMTVADFVSAVAQDFETYGKDNPDYAASKLYDMYVMNDQIQLITAKYIP